MSITVEQLKTKLIDKLAATHVVGVFFSISFVAFKHSIFLPKKIQEIEDVSDGCGAKFVAKIVSSKFDGLSLLEQHRLVNKAITDEMNLIHSFRMKTMTPEKFAAESSK